MENFLEFYKYLWKDDGFLLFSFTLFSHIVLAVFVIMFYAAALIVTDSWLVVFSPVLLILFIAYFIYKHWKEKNGKD